MCQGDCLRVVVFSPPSEGIPTPSSANVGSDSFFSFIFFCVSRMERRRYLSYPKRHCALSTHPYPHYDITMRLKTHTKPRRLRRALWTRPFRRAGQENVFRSASARDLFAVDTTSLVRLPSVRHPRHSVRVRARPPHTPLPPSLLLARPSVSFPLPYFFFVAFFSCPFHSVFSTMADFFSFPSPQDPPPVRVASESPKLSTFRSSIYLFLLLIFRFSSQQPTVRTSKSTHDPCIFIRHSPQRSRLFHLIPPFPSYFCTHISFIFSSFFFLSNAYIPNVCDP